MFKKGRYYYSPHRSMWGVWKKGDATDGVQTDDFVDDFPTREEAAAFVYERNGWKTKITN